jgi:hypothetical protein
MLIMQTTPRKQTEVCVQKLRSKNKRSYLQFGVFKIKTIQPDFITWIYNYLVK